MVKSLDEILSGANISKKGSSGAREPIRTLTEEHKKMFLAIVANKSQIKMDQEAIKDDIKAVSEKLGIKVGDVNKVVSLISKEQEKGGAIESENNIVSLAEQVLGSDSN